MATSLLRRRTGCLAATAAGAALALVGCTSSSTPEATVSTGPATVQEQASPSPSSVDDGPTVQRRFDEVPRIHPSVDGYGTGLVTLTSPDGQEVWELPVLVADLAQERQHGLMEVPSMPDGTGMVFLFDADRTGGFWMFQTLMDIDIVYVAEDGRPVSFLTMTPCPEQPCPSYPPAGPYRFTVEVPGGFWERIGFSTDWTVAHRA